MSSHAIVREKEAAYLTLITQVEPINAVVGIAREHHGKIPMAVASGGTHRIIEQVLEHLGIRHLFDAVVTSEDVVNQKPAPDIFLEAARRIGVPPQFCRPFEDTDLGLEAIRAAGMDVVDVRELIAKHRRLFGFQPILVLGDVFCMMSRTESALEQDAHDHANREPLNDDRVGKSRPCSGALTRS